MAFRLVATIDGKRTRFPLPPGEYLLGSHPDCALRLAHPSVSRQHAALEVTDGVVRVRDQSSRNGTRIAGERITVARLEPGVRIAFGAVEAVLEELPEEDLQPAVVLHNAETAASIHPPTPPDQTTWRSGMAEAFTLQRLPTLLDRLAAGESAAVMAQLVGDALFSTLPCTKVEVFAAGSSGVVFRAARDTGSAATEVVAAETATLRVEATFPAPPIALMFRPLVEAAAHVLRAAETREPPRSPSPRAAMMPPALPDPPSVVLRVRQIFDAASRVASGRVSTLILGESGTGKEVLARYIHAASPQAGGPLLALNCASLPRDLLESELFGIERGVATGVEARPGKFEQADHGTLFLDEIGDMAGETQAKILRVLQSGEVYRLGSRDARQVSVRILAATNRDVKRLLADGTFRSDLYHRLAGWVVEMPPLRERRADIPNLAAYFLARAATLRGIQVTGISRAAMDALTAYQWPGNIRQLETEMSRAVLFLEDGEMLDTGRLSSELRESRRDGTVGSLEETLRRVERDEILRALGEAGGVVDDAAARLAVSRATLYRRMKALEIDPRSL